MDFLLSEDLIEFNKVVRSFLEQEVTPAFRRRHLSDLPVTDGQTAADKDLADRFRALGVYEAVLPETVGGLGLGLTAAEGLLFECGRSLVPLPVFETVALGIYPLLALAGESAADKSNLQSELLGEIQRGSWASGAFFETLTGSELCTAEADKLAADKYTLSGLCRFIPSFEAAGLVFIPAGIKGNEGQCGLFVLRPGSVKPPAITAQPLETFDLLRTFSDVTLKSAPVQLCGKTFKIDEMNDLLSRIQILACAEALGAAGFAVDLTLDYVKMRKQFDRQIGSFQAIQHKLADMHTAHQRAASLNRFAAWCSENDPGQLTQSAAGSAAITFEEMPVLIEAAIQLHGGIGFTYEYDLHLFLRRVLTLAKVLSRSSANQLALAQGYLPR